VLFLALAWPGTGNRPVLLVGCRAAKMRFQKKIDPRDIPMDESSW
jgi:hypothetical protein